MPLCKEKKESIKSATIGLKRLLKSWRKDKKISDQEYILSLSWLRKQETCCNQSETYTQIHKKRGRTK